jgi:hypothetical protein
MTADINSILGIQWGVTRGSVSFVTIAVALYMLELQVGKAINNGIFFRFFFIFKSQISI